MRKLLIVLALFVLSAGIAPACWAKHKVYLAVGDSYAYGYTTDNPNDPNATIKPSFGAPGYVSAYAQFLDSHLDDGQNLKTVNLAIPGETMATFFDGGSPGASLNKRYDLSSFSAPTGGEYSSNSTSQYQMLLAQIEDARKHDREIHRITIQLGANDVQVLLFTLLDPSVPKEVKDSLYASTFAGIAAGYDRLLPALKEKAPEAQLVVIGYPNPFRALGPDFAALTDPLAGGLNEILAAKAAQYGATFIDVDARFAGHETEWTYITDDYGSPGPIPGVRLPLNGHANVTGYGVIASLLTSLEADD